MGTIGRWISRGALLLAAVARPAPARAALDAPAPLADDPTVIALAVALACSEPFEPAAAATDAEATPAAPSVEVVATVRARTIAFDEVPRADAIVAATSGARVTWRAERMNLPLHPRAGVVYRDVEVRLTLAATERALAAMLSEARRAAGGIRMEAREPAPAAAATPAPTPIPVETPAPIPTETPSPAPIPAAS